jgi:ribosomal protein L16/L10AE
MSGFQSVPIKGKEYRMKSGKHEGKSLGELLEINPGYIVFLHEKNLLTIQFDLIDEARAAVKLRNDQKGRKA